jgi:hypothetical protein
MGNSCGSHAVPWPPSTPLLTLPGVTGSDVAPKPYVDVLEEPPPPPEAMRMVDHNGFAHDVDDGLIARLTTAHAAFGAAVLMVRYLRGEFNRVPADAIAMAYRDAEAFVVSAAFLPPEAPDEAERRIREGCAAVAEDVTGAFGNFSPHPDPEVLTRMYPPATVERLRAGAAAGGQAALRPTERARPQPQHRALRGYAVSVAGPVQGTRVAGRAARRYAGRRGPRGLRGWGAATRVARHPRNGALPAQLCCGDTPAGPSCGRGRRQGERCARIRFEHDGFRLDTTPGSI